MSTLVAQTISNGTVSTSSENVIQGCAKAWVNFNGTTSSIRAAYNVSSITRSGTGVYTANFTNAFADTNYAYSCVGRTPNATGATGMYLQDNAAKTTTQFTFTVVGITGTNTQYDSTDCSIIVFR